MKNILLILFLSVSFSILNAQTKTTKAAPAAKPAGTQIVEAYFCHCQFYMNWNDCDLAVRINGKAYFVDGTGIDDHGDSHAKDGFCEKIRKAEIKGSLVNNRFLATYFKLLPEPVKSK